MEDVADVSAVAPEHHEEVKTEGVVDVEEDLSNKRKFEDAVEEDAGEDGPMRKRPSFNTPEDGFKPENGNGFTDPVEYPEQPDFQTEEGDAPGVEQPAANPVAVAPTEHSDYMECPKGLVGKLIGRQGATIQDLQGRSNCKIQINHQAAGDMKRVDIMGKTEELVARAKAMIQEVLDSENPSSMPGEINRTVECPQGIVGRVIGKGGETIRALQSASQAHIVVEQNFPDGVPRKVNVSGKADAVERAVRMVTELINGTPGSAQSVIQKHGVGITVLVDCPKGMVGRVIGKGGETIKNLQKDTGASIQIDQTIDPMKVTITGGPENVRRAEAAVRDIIDGNDRYEQQMGGPGAYGPRGGPGGYAQPFQQQYAPAAYAPGGYGGYGAPAANPYGAAPFYGGAPAYGGYGAVAAPSYNPGYGGYGQAAAADPYGYGSGAGGYGGAAGAQSAGGAGAGSLWQELHDSEGRAYFYNTQTGVSQWEKPAEMQ